jgi:tRNA(adenine34) deaminase
MENYFKICVELAQKAAKKGEVPIGAIIVYNDKIIAKSYNLREKKHDIMAHAEILVIKKAAKYLKRWNLSDCKLYVTLKPCSMCESVINQSRIKNVFYLCEKPSFKKEYYRSEFIHENIARLSEEYKGILKSFFAHKR